MIIKFNQVNDNLNHNLYFLYGSDLLAQGVFKKIIHSYSKSVIETFYLDSNFNWDGFQKRFLPSIDDECRLIKWYWLEEPKSSLERILCNFLSSFSKKHSLVIFYEKKDKKYRSKKWWSAIDNNGIIIDLWPLRNTNEVWGWIKETSTIPFSKYDLQIITDYLGNDLFSISQILKQLPLVSEHFNLELVIKQFLGYRKYDLHDLLNAIWENKPQQVIAIYQNLCSVNNLSLVLWGLANDFRLIWNIKNKLISINSSKIQFFRQKALQTGCNRVNLSKIKKWWTDLLDFEQEFKKGNDLNLLPLLLEITTDG